MKSPYDIIEKVLKNKKPVDSIRNALHDNGFIIVDKESFINSSKQIIPEMIKAYDL